MCTRAYPTACQSIIFGYHILNYNIQIRHALAAFSNKFLEAFAVTYTGIERIMIEKILGINFIYNV
jgi:hypothetical protein